MAFLRVRTGALLTTLFVTPLFAAACGGSDSPTSSTTGGGTKLGDAPPLLAKAFCETASACLGSVWDLFLRGEDCESSQATQIEESDFSLLQGAIDAKRASYDGTKVEPCVAAIKKAGCDLFTTRLTTMCPGIVTGTVDAGADCTLDAECKAGMYCNMGAACPGSCAKLESEGGACKKADDCKDGLVCSDQSTCVAPAKEGAECSGTAKTPCDFGLWCAGGSATATGTCKKNTEVFAAADGAACDPATTVMCTSGLSCTAGSLDSAQKPVWKCEAAATSTSCHLGYPDMCPTGQYCELGAQLPDATCKPLPGDGEPCAANSPNDPNADHSLCASTATCVSGTCKAVQHLGGACTTDEECFSRVCAKGSCAPNECETAPPPTR